MGLHNITMLYDFKWCTLFHINSYYIKRKYSRNIRHHDGCFLHMIFCCFSPLFEYWPQSITWHRWRFMNQHLEILKHCHCFRTNLHFLPTFSVSPHSLLHQDISRWCSFLPAMLSMAPQHPLLPALLTDSTFGSQLNHIRVILSNLTKSVLTQASHNTIYFTMCFSFMFIYINLWMICISLY